MKLLLPLLSLAIPLAQAAAISPLSSRQLPAICSNPVRGDCSFYLTCLESKYSCGSSGYPVGYGNHYCLEFSASKPSFSPAGAQWIDDTMLCLQTALIPEATTVTSTCEAVRIKAFDSHSNCYIDSGLCSLPPTDWLRIIGTVALEDLIGSRESLKETVEAGAGCLQFYLFLILHGIISP